MRTKLLFLLLAGGICAYGQGYAYDFTGLPGSSWTANGTVDSDFPSGIDFYADSGSFIYQPAVSLEINPATGLPYPASSANDYEVSMTMGAGGTTVVEYLRASSNALKTTSSSTGSYTSVELTGSTLVVNQCVSGSVTQLGSLTIPNYVYYQQSGPVTLRSVIWGTNLWVFLNNGLVYQSTAIPLTYGQPGIGGVGTTLNVAIADITSVSVGHHDVVAPNAPIQADVRSSILLGSVSLAWQPVTDDSAGIGFYRFNVYRNGSQLDYITGTPLLTDSTVLPSGLPYTYTIAAVDYHGNVSAAATLNVTSLPPNNVDARRTGIYTTGSYWGGGGEQIDTLSGNLNFSIPLVTPQGRTGWSIPIGLSYNSQNWRQDASYSWSLGVDTGYGYGWSMQIGSITPYYAGWTSGVDHYVYTDGTGAAYRLDQNHSGVWSSLQGIYVWFDANTNRLHFKDGKFWVMGCISSGEEQDAGTMYPTIIEDPNGNQVIVTYQAAVGFPSTITNTSARIVTIQDVREPYGASYIFYYTTSAIPHLSSVVNSMQTGEYFPSFTYAAATMGQPFGSGPAYTGTTTQLTNIAFPAAGPTSTTYPVLGQYSFTYDTAGASELTEVKFPWGGHLRWVYSNAVYSGSGTLLREVTSRYLAADAGGAVEWGPYSLTHTDSAGILTVHTDTTLADASGVGAKTWTFNTPGGGSPAWETGLASQFVQLASASTGAAVMTRDTYVWGQTGGSTVAPIIGANPFISQKTHTIDEGTTNVQSAQTIQTADAYGNTETVQVFPYNNTSTVLQLFTNTYMNSGYAPNYILNRLYQTTLTVGGVVKTLTTNLYDWDGYNGQPASSPCNGSLYFVGAPTFRNIDSTLPVGSMGRGLLTQTTSPAKSTCVQYDGFGNMASAAGSDGNTVAAPADSSTNYAAPSTLTTQSYNYSLGFNAWLGPTQTTGANGEEVTMGYDLYGRPTTGVSAYGLYSWYAYPLSYSLPVTLPTYQAKWDNGGTYTYSLLDGLGREAQVKTGDSTGAKSYTNSVYAPCACSPMGKLQKTSQPYATSGSVAWTQQITGDPLTWTTYTYDGIGRTLSVTQPDGVSATTYVYSGNTTKVTDPDGNWKIFTTDVLGNLTTVTEPDPANAPSGTVTTSYTHDWMNHLATSTMTRGSETQTRTFAYSDAGLLTSATNPESGTVTYTYDGMNRLADKHDANGQDTAYGYNSSNQIISVTYSQGGVVDACQNVTYTYGTDPTSYNYARLTITRHGTLAQVCLPNPAGEPTMYAESYNYTPAGDVAQKWFYMWRGSPDESGDTPYGAIQTAYFYDAWGRVSQTVYQGYDPLNSGATTVSPTYTFDTLGRPVSVTDGSATWVQNVTYDAASRVTSMQYPQYSEVSDYMTEAKTYNANGQLLTMQWTPGMAGQGAPTGTISYAYTGTGHAGNNGQVVQATDGVSGETIVYAYDALKRLTQAASTPTSGSTPAAWTQGYSYDGFGNLTGKTLGGTTTAIPVNGANQLTNSTGVLSNVSYDNNGNLLSVTSSSAPSSGLTMTYDEANRLASARVGTGGTEYYGYDTGGHRIYKRSASGVEEWTLYGVRGEKLGTFGWTESCTDPDDPGDCSWVPSLQTTNIWFGNKLLWSGTGTANTSGPVFGDKLGTNRAGGARFMPYGDEITSTANDHVKFATYTRDGSTGLDYAQARYYASAYGRFTSADPDGASMNPKRPGSWNRYTYASDDPVNRNDPSGKIDCWSWYLYVMNKLEDADTDSGAYGNCGASASETSVALDPCSVSPEWLIDNPYGVSCDATPPCYQADNSVACAAQVSGGGAGTTGGTDSGGTSPADQIVNAAYGAADRLFNPQCAGLFLIPSLDNSANMQFLAQTLENLADNNTIRQIAPGNVPSGTPSNIPAWTTGAGGIIYVISGGSFFTGTVGGQALGGAFSGLPLAAAQQLIILHEFLHYEGIGPDTKGQSYTLPNGDVVQGSQGITNEVFAKCFGQ